MRDAEVLGGVDVFHWVKDQELLRRGLPGNTCVIAIHLDGRLDPTGLDRRLRHAVCMMPELRAKLEAPLVGLLRWRIGKVGEPPALGIANVDRDGLSDRGEGGVSLMEEQLARPTSGASPWSLELLRGPHADSIVLRYYHSLADAKAAERLLTWLGSGEDDMPAEPPPEPERYETSERPIRALDRKRRLELMRAYNQHMMRLGRDPILSLWGASARPGKRARQRILRLRLSEEETSRFDARVRERAKLGETSVMVRLAARAMDAELVRRGFAPPSYLVPVPISLDPKLGSGRMLGNHLSMMTFALGREDLRDEARAIASLKDQQRAIIRDKLDLGMAAALDFARWTPRPVYQALSKRPFGGHEMGSFIFSNPGAITLRTFAGLRVTDAVIVPAVACPPGLQFIFSRFDDRLSAVIGYVDTALSDAAAERMAAELRRELVGE